MSDSLLTESAPHATLCMRVGYANRGGLPFLESSQGPYGFLGILNEMDPGVSARCSLRFLDDLEGLLGSVRFWGIFPSP